MTPEWDGGQYRNSTPSKPEAAHTGSTGALEIGAYGTMSICGNLNGYYYQLLEPYKTQKALTEPSKTRSEPKTTNDSAPVLP